MRVPLLHLLLACMCMCVRVYVCCTIQTIIYDTRRIEKREENEKEWRERFDDELREKNASPPIFPRKERRQGFSSLLFPLFIPINTIGSIFLTSTRLWKNCFETMFFETLFASRRVAFHFRIVTVLLTLLNLYGVYMHGHVLARVSTIRARLGVNIYRVDARISHVRTAN